MNTVPDVADRLVPEPNISADFASFTARLRERRVSGQEARRAIVERLAGMSLMELRDVSPAVFARLGTSGLVEVAERSAVLNAPGLAQVAEKSPKRVTSQIRQSDQTLFTRWQKSQPLPWEILKQVTGTAIVVICLAVVFPILWRFEANDRNIDHHRVCRQLDLMTGNCTYIVGSNDLTMEVAASMLGLPFKEINNLKMGKQMTLLRSGSRLIIPRRPWLNLR